MKITNTVIILLLIYFVNVDNVLSQAIFSTENINTQIVEIKSTSDDDSEPVAEPINRLFIGVNGTLNTCMIISSQASIITQWSPKSMFSFIPSLDIQYMLSKSIGLGLGLRIGKYSTGYSISDYTVTLDREFVDIDNDPYFPVYEDVSIDEVSHYSSIDIPVYANYLMGKGKVKYFAKLGFMVSSFTKTKYSLNGTLTRKGSYPQYNTILNNYPEYNYDYFLHNSTDVIEVGAPSTGFSGIGGFGILFDATKDFSLKLGVSGVFGFTDARPKVANDFVNFHTSTILDKTKLVSFGFEIGVYYKLVNK